MSSCPLLWTSGGAGGMVTRDAFERITQPRGRLSEAMPVDAVYLDLHGALVTDDFEDGEGSCCGACARGRAGGGRLRSASTITPMSRRRCRVFGCADRVPEPIRSGPRRDWPIHGEGHGAAARRGPPVGRALRKAPFLIPLNASAPLVDPSKRVSG